MSDVKCNSEVKDFAGETFTSVKMCVAEITETAHGLSREYNAIAELRARYREISERLTLMGENAKERIISLENTMLSSDESEIKRWQRSKEKLEEFLHDLKIAEDQISEVSVYFDKAFEEISEHTSLYMKCAEDFLSESEYGVGKLLEAASAIEKLAAVKGVSET